MGRDEKKLFEAFRQEVDIPLELQQRLGRTYEQLRQLGRAERESTRSHKKAGSLAPFCSFVEDWISSFN